MKNSFEINEYNGEVFEYKIPNTKHCIVKIPRDYLRKIDDSIYQEINTNIIYFLINKKIKKSM